MDKTKLIHQLVQGKGYVFLSRPRRFGKSLLLSTIEAYFEGKKELFSGLDIAQLEREWKSYPVLRFDFAYVNGCEEDGLADHIDSMLSSMERQFHITPIDKALANRFATLIELIYTQTSKQVVVLIDEYDKPLFDAIGNPTMQAKNRALLKSFYTVLKTQDRYIRFGFLTGISKFSKVTIFSGLNNLEDISNLRTYANICGITEKELFHYFDEDIHRLAAENALTYEDTYCRLRRRYDGYHFVPNSVGLYNPFSLFRTLKNAEFIDGWFESGTPTFLVEVLKKIDFYLPNLQGVQATAELLGQIDAMERTPLPLLYQSGYLTIVDYDTQLRKYTLDFPNEEVKSGFWTHLLPYYIKSKYDSSVFCIFHFVDEINAGQPDKFMKRMQAMFNDTTYQLVGDAEIYIHNVVYLLLRLMGLYVKAEYELCDGRIDILVETPLYVYITELKLNQTAAAALEQINTKDYAKIYNLDSRKLFRVGINFDTESRTITEYIIE